VSSTAVSVLVKGLRSLPVVFVDKATEAIAAHDRPSGSGEAEWRSALGYSEIEASVRTFSVVVIDIRLQHCPDVAQNAYVTPDTGFSIAGFPPGEDNLD